MPCRGRTPRWRRRFSGAACRWPPATSASKSAARPAARARRCLDRGLFVTGIDPADVDPAVLEHPRFRHLRKRGKDVRRKEFLGVRWLAADMNIAPEATLDTVEAIVTHPGRHDSRHGSHAEALRLERGRTVARVRSARPRLGLSRRADAATRDAAGRKCAWSRCGARRCGDWGESEAASESAAGGKPRVPSQAVGETLGNDEAPRVARRAAFLIFGRGRAFR